tara:strand:+ start:870 stop:1124 length:255 start_codon:yes stop_codon:yes gene_type:complete
MQIGSANAAGRQFDLHLASSWASSWASSGSGFGCSFGAVFNAKILGFVNDNCAHCGLLSLLGFEINLIDSYQLLEVPVPAVPDA